MAERYPDGMHGAIAAGIAELLQGSVVVNTATQDQPEHGLTEEVLAGTDVLTWWGHAMHDSVEESVLDRVHDRVLGGMGLLVLHSAHFSKIFRRADGHDLLAGLAQLPRHRADLDRQSIPSNSRWCPASDHDQRA